MPSGAHLDLSDEASSSTQSRYQMGSFRCCAKKLISRVVTPSTSSEPTTFGATITWSSHTNRFACTVRRAPGHRRPTGPLDGAAFLAGLAAPRIFCDDRLPDILSADEQQAVALHEHAHQVARDPLRMALVGVVAPVARRLPAGEAWLERRAASREIAADRAALSHGASRTSIASALLKVGPLHPADVPGFAPAVDLRLEALLEGERPTSPRGWAGKLTGLGLAASLCVVTLPHGTPTVLGSLCF